MQLKPKTDHRDDAAFPSDWIEIDGARFKVAGAHRPAFQRALELSRSGETDPLKVKDEDVINDNIEFSKIVATYLILGWEGITDADGNIFEFSDENKIVLSTQTDRSAELVVRIFQAAKDIQEKALIEKSKLLGKSGTDSKPTEKAPITRKSKKQETKPSE